MRCGGRICAAGGRERGGARALPVRTRALLRPVRCGLHCADLGYPRAQMRGCGLPMPGAAFLCGPRCPSIPARLRWAGIPLCPSRAAVAPSLEMCSYSCTCRQTQSRAPQGGSGPDLAAG